MANIKEILAKVRAGAMDKGLPIPSAKGTTIPGVKSKVSTGYRLPPGGTDVVIRASTTTPDTTRMGTILNVPDSVKKNIFGMQPNELVINVEELGLGKYKSSRVPPPGTVFVDVKPFRPTEMSFKDYYQNIFTKDIIRDPKDLAQYKNFRGQQFIADMNKYGELVGLKGGLGMGYKTYTKDMLDDLARKRGYVLQLDDGSESIDNFLKKQFDKLNTVQASDVEYEDYIKNLKGDPKLGKYATKNFAKNRIMFAMDPVIDGVSVDAVMEAKKELGDKFNFDKPQTKKLIAQNFKKLIKPVLWGPVGVMAVISEGLAAETANPLDDSLSTKQRIERGEVYTVDEQTQRDFYRDNPEVATLVRTGDIEMKSPRIGGMDPLGLFKPKNN